MIANFVNGLKAFYAKPYKGDGDALDWFLFFGFSAACVYLWHTVVKEIGA